jgi:hypothetical protein
MPESSSYLAGLQSHTSERPLELPASARLLRAELVKVLVSASNASKIKTSPSEIHHRITLMDSGEIARRLGAVADDLRSNDLQEGAFCIVGGEKNQERDKSLPHFERDDGAWFDFSITVREAKRRLELLAYDFEIRFEPGMGSSFLRFDLNLPDHRNQFRDLRCHLHPGCDDLLVPAPLMTPIELLRFFIEEVRLPAERKPRGVTAFEISWLQRSWERHAPSGREEPFLGS